MIVREIKLYKEHFREFMKSLPVKVRKKFEYVLNYVRTSGVIPEKFFKKLEGTELYEIRVKYEKQIYRVFCFFDDGRLVILLHGFIKKTQKTPSDELDKALRLQNEYLEQRE